MKESLTRVRKTLGRKDLVAAFSHYLVRNRTITASDGRMVSCAPFDWDGEFLVPGVDFERLVDRLPDVTSLTVDEDSITVRSARMRGTIKTMPLQKYEHHTRPSDNWQTPPTRLLEAFKLVRPFISDNAIHPWALSTCLGADSMYATTNVTAIKVDCPLIDGAGHLLPHWAIDYVLSRKDYDLTGFQLYPNYAAFLWDDDSWMRTKLIDAEFPSALAELFQKHKEPTWELTAEWREAYDSVSELAEGVIEVYGNKLVGRQEQSVTEHEIPPTPVPEGMECTKWQPTFMDAVVEVATHWQPDAYPNPAPFGNKAQGVQGFIMGRR